MSSELPRQLLAVLDVLDIDVQSKSSLENVVSASEKFERIIFWLYRILDILDSKTSHLLRHNSLILAAQAVLTGLVLKEPSAPQWAQYLIVLILAPIAATAAALPVFRVAWPFLGRLRPDIEEPSQRGSRAQELVDLAEVCDDRTRWHRRVWYLSALSTATVAIVALVATFTL